MKHNLLSTANGLCTPPCGSSHRKSLSFQLRNSLLLLFLLLMVGSSAAWADDYALNNPIGADGYYIVKWDCANSTWASSNSMQIGETFTFAIDITGNSYLLGIVNSGHTIAFAHYAGDGYAREYTADCFRLKQISGNIYGATYNFKKDKPDWDTQKIWARFWDGNNWDYPGKEIHSPTKNGLFKWATNTGATSPDFTPEQIAADGGMPNGHQRNGYAAPCACEETGGDPEPEPLSGDYYVFGDGGTNWVTGWSGNWNNENYKMTIKDGVATKTFNNVSGQGLEFKIHKGNTQYTNSYLLEEIPENNSHLIKRVWKNGTNIDFSISDINVTHKADVTVHFDGEHIWLTAVPSPETVTGSEWYIMGFGNVGTENGLDWNKGIQKGRGNEHKMTVQGGVATITYYNVSNNQYFVIF